MELIPVSARLSRSTDEAAICLHQANMAIEDAILAEYAGDRVGSQQHVAQAIAHVKDFKQKLAAIDAAWKAMFHEMERVGYKGNPLAATLHQLRLRESFSHRLLPPAIATEAWQELELRFQKHNLPQTFAWERSLYEAMQEPADNLIAVLEVCRAAAEAGKLVESVELNVIPLRQYFAPLYSMWHYASQVFLYSAMICTELFYRTHALGSLAETPPVDRVKRQFDVV